MGEPIRILPRGFCLRVRVNIEKAFLHFFSQYLNNEHKQVSGILEKTGGKVYKTKNLSELECSVRIGKILVSSFFFASLCTSPSVCFNKMRGNQSKFVLIISIVIIFVRSAKVHVHMGIALGMGLVKKYRAGWA